jgi:hypothetical protein
VARWLDPAARLVESVPSQLAQIVDRVRDGHLRTHIATVATLNDAVLALNPTQRRTRQDRHLKRRAVELIAAARSGTVAFPNVCQAKTFGQRTALGWSARGEPSRGAAR